MQRFRLFGVAASGRHDQIALRPAALAGRPDLADEEELGGTAQHIAGAELPAPAPLRALGPGTAGHITETPGFHHGQRLLEHREGGPQREHRRRRGQVTDRERRDLVRRHRPIMRLRRLRLALLRVQLELPGRIGQDHPVAEGPKPAKRPFHPLDPPYRNLRARSQSYRRRSTGGGGNFLLPPLPLSARGRRVGASLGAVMGAAERLQVRGIIAAARCLGHDVVELGGEPRDAGRLAQPAEWQMAEDQSPGSSPATIVTARRGRALMAPRRRLVPLAVAAAAHDGRAARARARSEWKVRHGRSALPGRGPPVASAHAFARTASRPHARLAGGHNDRRTTRSSGSASSQAPAHGRCATGAATHRSNQKPGSLARRSGSQRRLTKISVP